LLLLSKIENNQFVDVSRVQLKDTVTKVLANYQDIIDAKQLQIQLNINTDVVLEMNSILADVLITNLVQNAIRHNTPNGKIIIEILDDGLIISNTGDSLNVNSKDLFVRFKKNDASKESLGLGLSIVQSIVKLYDFKIDYSYHNAFHTFTLKF